MYLLKEVLIQIKNYTKCRKVLSPFSFEWLTNIKRVLANMEGVLLGNNVFNMFWGFIYPPQTNRGCSG